MALLNQYPEIRARYQGREFTQLLVDEFQDTNSAQWDISLRRWAMSSQSRHAVHRGRCEAEHLRLSRCRCARLR
ncbi:UvrD-helicase domain-containing protein [bacterium]|nr:UvrD-helicase domain-containing protein [bacterium]